MSILQGMNLKELDDILRRQLAIADYDDISLNGVQVACSPDRQIARVAVAVDACQATIDAAIQEKAGIEHKKEMDGEGMDTHEVQNWQPSCPVRKHHRHSRCRKRDGIEILRKQRFPCQGME